MNKQNASEMTQGPFFKKIILFAVPVTLTGLLQIVYNTADTAVVGQFAGKTALAAVGSTGSMISLIVNLFTILVLHWGVAEVAVATISAQYLTAFLALRRLMTTEDAVRLTLRDVRFSRQELKEILRIGVPAGLQNALFSISNVIIQSNVNSFGSDAMAGISAGSKYEQFNNKQ
ncbi:MAG: hypothetical protein IJK02_12095 [Clostridia bacterium]|nr:hypothetical protein [Clostridia bacterium]